MPELNSMAMRLYRRLFAGKAASLPEDGVDAVLDGSSAVAVTEAGIAEGAALGSSFPAAGSDLAWRSEQEQRKSNAFGELLATWDAEGGRGSLAAAMGLAMAGQRQVAVNVPLAFLTKSISRPTSFQLEPSRCSRSSARRPTK